LVATVRSQEDGREVLFTVFLTKSLVSRLRNERDIQLFLENIAGFTILSFSAQHLSPMMSFIQRAGMLKKYLPRC